MASFNFHFLNFNNSFYKILRFVSSKLLLIKNKKLKEIININLLKNFNQVLIVKFLITLLQKYEFINK